MLALGGLLLGLAGPIGCNDRRVNERGSMPPDDSSGEALPEPELLVPLTQQHPASSDDEIHLPPAPVLERPPAPLRYDDGAYSVAGLREDPDERLREGEAGQEVVIRAYVSRVYVPPACFPGDTCPPPKQPHVWLTDHADDRGLRHAMLLVNYRFAIPEWDAKQWRDQPDVVLEEGKQYTFKGRFKQFSDTGFAHSEGLLEFVAYRPRQPETGAEQPQWVYPPGAPWHPVEIQRQEEMNRALAERAAAAARSGGRSKPRKRSKR